MKNQIGFICALLVSSNIYAQQAGWGTTLENETKKVKIGGRIQAIMENDSATESQDFYLRRLRVNLEYKPVKGHTFSYDVRNDGANQANKGEQTFNIGDAYWKIDFNKHSINNFKLFRSKVDVSYSQTASSKNLFNPVRAGISDHVSNFIVHNRRAANVQFNGNIGKMAYHVVVSDGVYSGKMADVAGKNLKKVNHQKFTYGGKIRYFFFGDAKKNKVQDTFYGQYDTFSVGAGYFQNDKINVTNDAGGLTEFSMMRKLTNIELSYAKKNFRFLSEYFYLSGDLIDLTQTSKENIIGDSQGYSAQSEYLIGKWAPYIIYENWDKNLGIDDTTQVVTTLGLNYYENMEAQRYGLAFKKIKNEKSIGDNESELLYAYFMLNY